MGVVGCYTLHLYCDNPEHEWGHMEFPHEYAGRNCSQCVRQARKAGWKVDTKRGEGFCPKCTQEKKHKDKQGDHARKSPDRVDEAATDGTSQCTESW